MKLGYSDYERTYAGMADGELLKLSTELHSLLDIASKALLSELDRRKLRPEAPRQPEEPHGKEGFYALAVFSTTPEAEMVRELLSQTGIACVLQGGNVGALEPLPRQGGFSEIRLLVKQTELSRAQELYEAFFVSSEAVLQEDEDTSASAQQDEQ